MAYERGASLKTLRQRAAMLAAVRGFFAARGVLEVETPGLSSAGVTDPAIESIAASVRSLGSRKHYLQTSPEFAMKRLLAAGATAIYQITKAFRGGGEIGPRHNPEFTIVEWYRVGDDYAAGMQLLSDLAEATLGCGPAERVTYREAFRQHAGIDPFGPFAIEQEVHLPADDRDLYLDFLLTTRIEEKLGRARPVILHDYPANQAALARICPGDPPVAERFELYVHGVELANGYHELLEAAVLRERNQANNALRASDGKYTLPAESRLLAAMDHGLPACSGCALGFDRLVMVATGATTIQEVLAFPIDRA